MKKQSIRFCTTPDHVRLAYAVSGEGLPLVMSATWLSHLEYYWRSPFWRPWLDAFNINHKLLRHDSRGCWRLSWLGSLAAISENSVSANTC